VACWETASAAVMATHFTPLQAHAASHHAAHHSAAAATAIATARLHASAPLALCPPPFRAAAAPATGCPSVQNPIFVGPDASWVQPRRADAGAALGPEFRRVSTTKTISKRSRGAGTQDRLRASSSAAVGRCVDKLLRVAPEDR
jgi:hypothetical protein